MAAAGTPPVGPSPQLLPTPFPAHQRRLLRREQHQLRVGCDNSCHSGGVEQRRLEQREVGHGPRAVLGAEGTHQLAVGQVSDGV